MRRFRRLFALLFILSLFAGAFHEARHNHHLGELCEVCVLAHAPGLLTHTPVFVSIEQCHLPFLTADVTLPFAHYIPTRSRSPPIS